MQTYTKSTNAKRAAISQIAKAMGITKDEVKNQADDLFTIENHDNGGFYWRRNQNEDSLPKTEEQALELTKPEPEVEAEPEVVEENPVCMFDHVDTEDDDDEAMIVSDTLSSTGILRKSAIVSPCKVVWDIAGEMEGERRKDIIAACVKAGIATNTAKTQYQRYREALRSSN